MIILKTGEVEEAYQQTLGYFDTPGAIKSSLHFLKSGKPENYFFDIDYLLNDPVTCEAAVRLYVQLIHKIARQHRVDFLAFIEKPTGGQKPAGGSVGAIRLAAAISIYSGIPNVIIRIAKLLSSERVKLQYNSDIPQDKRLAGANAIIVIDHCSEGKELFGIIDAIKENGGEVTDVVAYTTREDLAPWEKFEERGVKFHFVHRLNEDPPIVETQIIS